MTRHFQNIKTLRIFLWVILFLIVSPFFLLLNLGIRETALVPMLSNNANIVNTLNNPGCFYDFEVNCFGINSIPLGADVKDVAKALDMESWAPDERPRGNILYYRPNIYFKAFDSVYSITFCVDSNGNCNMVRFSATPMRSASDIPLRSFSSACDYVDSMFQKFVTEYGEPTETNFGTYNLRDVPRNRESDNLYAVWRSENESLSTELKINAYTVLYSSNAWAKSEIIFQISTGLTLNNEP